MTAPIASDLKIKVSNEAWILGTYSMIFAATRGSNLSSGREMLTFLLSSSTFCWTSCRPVRSEPRLHHRFHWYCHLLPDHLVHDRSIRLFRIARVFCLTRRAHDP